MAILKTLFAVAASGVLLAQAQSSCSTTIAPSGSIKPSVASGYAAAVIATGLTSPRSLEFDSAGNLLVIESGKGLTSHTLNDQGGTCISINSSKTLIENDELDHGIALSPDGNTIYVSDSDKVYSYSYSASGSTVSGNGTVLIYGMSGKDHVTRTLLIPRSAENQIVVSRGSTQNIDDLALEETTGVSQVRAFDLSQIPSGGYNYTTSGTRLGWGLRNEVGVGEHPNGGIWGVENSADQLARDGVDVHATNPAEELNWLGYLNGTQVAQQGTNFGYPTCFTVWDASVLPNAGSLTTGDQFALNSNVDCSNYTSPRLAFHPHTAPLDIKFNNSGNDAWISYHGSWNSPQPVGYYVGFVQFADGQPVAPSTSNTSLNVVLGNMDNSKCPGDCLRPAGIRFDSQGRLLVTSDASGELYVVQRTTAASNSTTNTTTGTNGGTPTSGGSATTSSGAAVPLGIDCSVASLGFLGLLSVMIGLMY